MSNHLAIATVTTVLQQMIQASIQADLDGARVTTVRPEQAGGAVPETGVNLYLYYVAINKAWRNADLRTRDLDGHFFKRPQVALDLHYLITCYGNDVELEPQRLMGSALQALHARPVLTRDMIEGAIAASNLTVLQDSNLGNQVEQVKLMPLSLTTEQLSNLWSVFFQVPYALSIGYQAGVVLIESADIPQQALPVRDRRFGVMPNQPMVERVLANNGQRDVITLDSRITIYGRRLQHEPLQVRLGAAELVPEQVGDQEITLDLATVPLDGMQAGVQSLQVVHRHPADPVHGVASNALPFILRPQVRAVTLEAVTEDEETRSGDVTLTLHPPVQPGQRVTLLLNERASTTPSAYSFEVDRVVAAAADLTIPIRAVKPGSYLVRVQVDGAESMLTVDTDRASATFDQYIAPVLVVP